MKSEILKVFRVGSPKQNKQERKLKKEKLINEPKETRLRQNPKQKHYNDYLIK